MITGCVEARSIISTKIDLSLVELDDALQALEQLDPRKARVVELGYFGGLSVEETAEALGVGAGTVMRDWRLARAWLRRELHQSPGRESEDPGPE